MSPKLYVHHSAGNVGILEHTQDGAIRFAYSSKWLQSPESFPISLTLPLRQEPFSEPARTFFSNLLPEGDSRQLLCQRLGISVGNDFELLSAIGGECAGALSLSSSEDPPKWPRADYRRLPAAELERLAQAPILPALDGRGGLRLSLAGAQDKIPVFIDGTSIHLPVGDSPTTHILKFPNQRFKHLPANETLVAALARQAGLPVVDTELWDLRKEGMCVVRRYDRVRSPDGRVLRMHQEDLCQALGFLPIRKYEKEGGPTFAQCFERVRSASTDPIVDSQNLLRWLAFNALAFNADGHAKNLSLLYQNGELRLAPFYDLVCTRAYPRLGRDLAMGIGEESDATLIRRRHWEKLAQEAGLGSRFVVQTVKEMAERFADSISPTAAEFREKYGRRPALELVVPTVRRQAKRALQLWIS